MHQPLKFFANFGLIFWWNHKKHKASSSRTDKSLLTLFKTPLESIQRSPYGHYIGLGLVLEFADGAVKVTVGVLGVLEEGGPLSRRFGYFCL